MNNTLRAPLFCLLCILLFAVGCTHSIPFNAHAPYSTRNKIAKPLVIVVPDYADQIKYRTLQRKLYYINKYDIYYGQAMAVQATARLEPKMERVVILTDTEFSTLMGVEPEGLEFIQPRDKKPQEFEPIDKVALAERLEFLPEIVKEDIGYLLIIRRVNFVFEGGVGQYMLDVDFRDRETNESIFAGIIRGRGKPMPGAEGAHNYKIQLTESVSSAFGQAFTTIEQEMEKELGLK